MSYTANTPQSTQTVSSTQSLINANFQALAPFGNGYGVFTNQVAAPAAGAGNNALYNFNNPTTLTNELYVHRIGTAGLAEVPMTASKMSNNVAADCTSGWSYLPSGLLIKWGTQVAASATVAMTPTVISGGPNFSTVFQVFLTAVDTSANTDFTCGQRTTPNNTSGNFNAYCANPSATTFIQYLVIGI